MQSIWLLVPGFDPDKIPTKLWHHMWNPHRTSAPQFGVRFVHGNPRKLRHQSLVNGSNKEKPPNFATKVLPPKFGDGWNSRWKKLNARKWLQSAEEFGIVKVRCRIFGMFSVLTKIRHRTFTDPATSRKEFLVSILKVSQIFQELGLIS